jgi:DNA polymerase-4
MPISEAYRRCPQAVYLRPNMELYSAVSEQVMEILGRFSPVLEPVSIDEAFLDITGMERLFGTPLGIGQRVKAALHGELQLTASVGIGPNRAIAKLASDFHKPDGLTIVSPEEVLGFLAPLPVSKLSGVGAKTASLCEQIGVRTVAQLRALEAASLQHHFGRQGGLYLYDAARGVASDVVGVERVRQSISKETTFEHDTSDQRLLHDTLLGLACEVGSIARQERLSGRVATLKIRLQGFETHTRRGRLADPTHSDTVIFKEGWDLYRRSGFVGRLVRLIGVGLTDLVATTPRQGDLFGRETEEAREDRRLSTVDSIRRRFGDKAIGLGVGGEKPRRRS